VTRQAALRNRTGEQGIALVSAILVGTILVLLSVLLLSFTIQESGQSARSVRLATATQAAEAGLDDYISKLTQDHEYHLHFVHPAESTRRSTSGALTTASNPWSGGGTWTYPVSRTTWLPLGNGYEYNLQIEPPVAGSRAVRVVTTGRKIGSTKELRTFEALVRPASPLDFQRIVNGDLSYGTTATTNGKVYVGSGCTTGTNPRPCRLDHPGTARADVYSEGDITTTPTLQNGAGAYDRDSNPSIRTRVLNPINFSAFTVSFVDVKAAAQSGGILIDDPAVQAWRISFQSNGQIQVQKCRKAASGADFDQAAPRCGASSGYTSHTTTFAGGGNGAIYVEQPAIVSGSVNGRITVVTNQKFIVEGATSYVDPRDDTLGLIARDQLVIARYAPDVLTWYASVIVQGDTWKTSPGASQKPVGSTMNFYGSATTNLGGDMTMYRTRNYNYDPNLQYLQPPYFPVLEDAYTIAFFREAKS
jgi:hypothetical protein